MNCVTSSNSQRNVNKLPDLHTMIFLDSRVTGNITFGHRKLTYVINYGLKKYFFEEFMGLVENGNHFTVCIGKFLSHISQ